MRATLAATVAIGLGVVLAKAGRERLAARRAHPDLGLLADEPLEQGLRRMALEQLDLAIAQLACPEGSAPDEKAVHEARKALKRLRALLRMLEPALGSATLARESAALGEVAQRLAGARDSKVILATLDALLERHPRKLASSSGVQRLREHLAREHERIRACTIGDAATRALALAALRACRARVQSWQLPALRELELVEPGLRRLYGQGRKRLRRVKRGKGDQVIAMHEWRKRVKDLRYAAEMLRRCELTHAPALPGGAGRGERRRRAHARRQAKFLRDTARAADDLGEMLGEDHDLAVLAQLVRAHAAKGAQPRLRRRPRRGLLKAIARRRRRLRARALRDGAQLYARGPSRFLRRIRASDG
jgi:CHAD domain-containing protein